RSRPALAAASGDRAPERGRSGFRKVGTWGTERVGKRLLLQSNVNGKSLGATEAGRVKNCLVNCRQRRSPRPVSGRSRNVAVPSPPCQRDKLFNDLPEKLWGQSHNKWTLGAFPGPRECPGLARQSYCPR